MAVKVFLLMILLHVIDDFHLQGILANMKQKEWWKSLPMTFDEYIADKSEPEAEEAEPEK